MNTPVAILVRVSTLKQETDRQINELNQLATSRGWSVVEMVFEHGVSGANDHRPGLERCMELAKTGVIEKVLVHEVSRVARKNSIAHKFLEDLAELKVSLYWHAHGIETLLPNGKQNPAAGVMFSLLAEMARAERETLVDRITSGLAEAKRKGVILGRPCGTGLTETALVAKHSDVVRLLRAGQSIRHAAAISRKSKATVEKVKKALVRL